MTANSKPVTGVQEWAVASINIQRGCEHDCRYCFAKDMALWRHQTTVDGWREPVIDEAKVRKGWRKREGTVMFPSTHDITPRNLSECLLVLEKLLAAGNRVLIVSKPHLACVQAMCARLAQYRDRILFRFTVGSTDDRVLGYWEPGAPAFAERLDALRYAHDHGFETSVSCEPMLDANIDAVIAAVRPFVSHSIWLGRANSLVHAVTLNCPGEADAIVMARRLNATWDDAAVRKLYERYGQDRVIRWKDSIKKVIGLPGNKESGLDQ